MSKAWLGEEYMKAQASRLGWAQDAPLRDMPQSGFSGHNGGARSDANEDFTGGD